MDNDRYGSPSVLNLNGDRSPSPSYVPLMAACVFGALDAAFLLCRAPRPPVPFAPHGVLLLRSMLFVIASAATGTAASLLVWSRRREGARLPLPFVVLASATASVWAPCIVLFFRQDSPWILPFSILAAAVLALCWRSILPKFEPPDQTEVEQRQIFAKTLAPLPPRNAVAFWLALCLYAAPAEILDHDPITASGLLMMFSFCLSWQLIQPHTEALPSSRMHKRAIRRLLSNSLAAVLITYIALHAWNPKASNSIAHAATTTTPKNQNEAKPKNFSAMSASARSGYQSIVLWPILDKKKFVLPPPPGTVSAIDHLSEPLVITFTGAYWYFQAPHHAPGSQATMARGTPLFANVRSTNSIPLLMEAHQQLGTHVSLSCCRSIRLEFQSCDNFPGDTLLGIALKDSNAKPEDALTGQAVYLGAQPIPSSPASQFMTGCIPRAQAMEFLIPPHPSLRRFNQITVIFSTDPARSEIGARVALKQFELLPR